MNEEMQESNTKQLVKISLAGIIGIAIGYGGLALIPNVPINAGFYMIAPFMFCLLIGYIIQVVWHELGHLLFGLLTGYSFVSFRVGPFMVTKREGKLQRSLFASPGLGGQCLMDPPDYNDGRFPFVLYHLGGILLNLLTAGLALLLVGESFGLASNMLLVGFAFAGIFMAVLNGIPRKVNGTPNDGYNIRSMMKDKETKHTMWLLLKINALLTKGVRPKDVPLETNETGEGADFSNPMNFSLQLARYNHYLDQLDFPKAKACLEAIEPYEEHLMPIQRQETKVEALFLELVGTNDPAVVQEIYNEEMIQHIQATHNWLNKNRLLMAYEIYQRNDPQQAMSYYQSIMDTAPRYPIQGEGKMEMALAEWLKQQIKQ